MDGLETRIMSQWAHQIATLVHWGWFWSKKAGLSWVVMSQDPVILAFAEKKKRSEDFFNFGPSIILFLWLRSFPNTQGITGSGPHQLILPYNQISSSRWCLPCRNRLGPGDRSPSYGPKSTKRLRLHCEFATEREGEGVSRFMGHSWALLDPAMPIQVRSIYLLGLD